MRYYSFIITIYLIMSLIGYNINDNIIKESQANNIKVVVNNNFDVIFYNNLKLLLINISSCLSFGIVSIINIIINGLQFGYLLDNIKQADEYSYFLSYSILETMGIIISSKIGIELGIILYQNLFFNKKFTFPIMLKYELPLCIILIIIGAFIESNFTL